MKWVLNGQKGSKVLLMGNEAIARGAIEAGVRLAAAYPGTPSSEIGEVLGEVCKEVGLYFEWSTNETVAFEVAAGASLVGARSMTMMKNAGLNLIMDMFMTLPYGGIKGGLVIVVADDPDAHYSSNEQDTRIAGIYAELPVLEPSSQDQAKNMTREAFSLSENLELPVVLRSVTRISHASGNVEFGDIEEHEDALGFNKHWKMPYRWNVYGPPGPVDKHKWLHSRFEAMREYSENSRFNTLDIKGNCLGIITSGIASTYVMEALDELKIRDNVNLLTLGMINPLPVNKVSKFLNSSSKVLVIEEGDPAVETSIRVLARENGKDLEVCGKMFENRLFEPIGELNTDIVRTALEKVLGICPGIDDDREKARAEVKSLVSPRSSTLCAGCPHLGSYWALRKVLEKEKETPIVNGDIGCYEQGGYGLFSRKIKENSDDAKRYRVTSPYEILDTIYIMGSGIGMAQGQYHAGYNGKTVAVAGDSTFFHTCLPSLANAVYNDADITFLVFDNSWTCMTGHQPNPVTGIRGNGDISLRLDIEAIARSMGVKQVSVADPYDIKGSMEAIGEGIGCSGPSVVILRRECALQVLRRKEKSPVKVALDREKCTGCRTCLQLGCPAVVFKDGKADLDRLLCVDCGICSKVCPMGAIIIGDIPSTAPALVGDIPRQRCVPTPQLPKREGVSPNLVERRDDNEI